MSRESEVADLLRADTTLLAILTGGIYEDGVIGVEGIRRGAGSPTADAFDVDGFLLPCAIVRQGIVVPAYGLRDLKIKHTSTSQAIYIFYYEDRGHVFIDAGMVRAYDILEGHPMTGAYQLVWMEDSEPRPDAGPIKNSTARQQKWQFADIRKPSS